MASQPAPSHHPRPDAALDPRERRKRRREGIIIVLLLVAFIALTVAEFRLTKLSSTLPFVTSIFFFGLLNFNIIILLALMWLVFRNIGKVFIERRSRLLGSRLKTKLVIAFLGLSITPTLVLFVISALYINSSFDKWFSLKVQNTLQASLEITATYYRNTVQSAMHFAEHLAGGVGGQLPPLAGPPPEGIPPEIPDWVEGYLITQRELLALDAVEFYQDPMDERAVAQRPVGPPSVAAATPGLPEFYPRLSVDLLEKALSGEHVSVIQHIGTGDLIRCLVPVHAGGKAGGPVAGVLAVSSYIPVSLVNKVDEIASVFDDYNKVTNPLKYPIKTTYFLILVMITLVILFVAIWIGLYMARELTVPVERLVHGAKAVGAGNLDVSISATGHDEIAVLVETFNRMTSDLRENRRQLTEASADLEKRRMQLEAILANIGTGVVAIDNAGVITTVNRAAARLLQIDPVKAIGQRYADVVDRTAAPLAEVIGRAFANFNQAEEPSLAATAQWNSHTGENAEVLAAVATPLRDGEVTWGVVAVIDDMTPIIKGQREMAWREVARRIAHEIKNPLTPIKLSAQRLRRRFGELRGRDGDLLQECTDTIIKHTDELKEMVNEFSNFARFPQASPAPHDLNEALGEVATLFKQAHPKLHFQIELEARMPIFDFDRDQIKRVVINLFDNAIAALSSRQGMVRLTTHYNGNLEMAVIQVEDNGPGMTEEVRARVFEPYFSTKSEGTGLGLAIAKRIVNDHDGFIRVYSNPGEGTRFVIELPTRKSRAVAAAETPEFGGAEKR